MLRNLLIFSIEQKNNNQYFIHYPDYTLTELFYIWYCLTFNKML